MKDLDSASWLSLSEHIIFNSCLWRPGTWTLSYQHSKPYLFVSAPCLKDINKCLLLLLWLRLSSQAPDMVKIRPGWVHSCSLNLCSEHHAIELTLLKPRLQKQCGLLPCSCWASTLGSLVKLTLWILSTATTIMYSDSSQGLRGEF